METKVCANCNVEKSLTLDSFYKDKHKSDGFTARCKECIKKQQNKRNTDEPERKKAESRKHYWKYREKILKNQKENRDDEYHKNYYLEHKEEWKKYRKKYIDNNQEKIVENRRKGYYRNREKILERNRKHYSENKEYYITKSRKRHHKIKYSTCESANQDLISRIYQNCPDGYHVDHMISLSKGGRHHESNLCYLPASVNKSKGAKSIEEFGVEVFNEYVIYWQEVLPLGE